MAQAFDKTQLLKELIESAIKKDNDRLTEHYLSQMSSFDRHRQASHQVLQNLYAQESYNRILRSRNMQLVRLGRQMEELLMTIMDEHPEIELEYYDEMSDIVHQYPVLVSPDSDFEEEEIPDSDVEMQPPVARRLDFD